MAKIVLQGYIDVAANDLYAVQQALPEHIALTLAEPGCLVFRVTPDQTVSGRFTVYEEFADQADFDAHQQRVKASHWGKITSAVKRHYAISSID